MWVEELSNGKYRVVERYLDQLTGKSKKISITIEKNTKKEIKIAEQILREKIAKKMPSINNAEDITLKSLTELYIEDQEQLLKKSTSTRNKWACKVLLKMLGENTIVNNITAGYVRTMLLKSGPDSGTYNEYLRRYKQLIRWAYNNDYVKDINYLSKLKPLVNELKKEKIEDKYLEPDQLNMLINGMPMKKWKTVTQFLVLSGLRIGEALALEISDIDLKNREIHVTKTLDTVNNVITSTKTSAGTRDVYIQDELLPIIKEMKENAQIGFMANGTSRLLQDNFAIMFYPAYRRYLSKKGKDILGKKYMSPHVLRHTHISLLAAEGLSFDEIARRVGHEDSKITRDIYFHVTEKLKEKEREHIKDVHIL